MVSYAQERRTACDAARQAARLCLAVQREMAAGPDRMEKSGREPVTLADYGSQTLILRALAEHFPEDTAFAEERSDEFDSVATSDQRQHVARLVAESLGVSVSPGDIHSWLDFGQGRKAQRIWAIDPIDGTKGFLRGDQFAIAIGLLVEGQVVLSALACPMLPVDPRASNHEVGILAVAVRGEGATVEPLAGGTARLLRVSKESSPGLSRIVESFESGHSDHAFSARVLAAAGVAGQPVRLDSQAKYALLADGRAEIYIRHSMGEGYSEKVWDHAAGTLVVEEAGGRVTDLDGKPLDFSAGERLAANHGVVATNGLVHETLLTAIRGIARAP